MMYSQSQKSNIFQIALSQTLQQFGITKERLECLRNLGIAAHPQTVKVLTKSPSSTHSSSVLTFIESAIEKNQFIIFCIDDYHNMHTQHQPESKIQTQAIHMTTLLLNVFPNVKAVQHHGNNVVPNSPVEIENVKSFVSSNLSTLQSHVPKTCLMGYWPNTLETSQSVWRKLIVTNQVLPPGFISVETPPNPDRYHSKTGTVIYIYIYIYIY